MSTRYENYFLTIKFKMHFSLRNLFRMNLEANMGKSENGVPEATIIETGESPVPPIGSSSPSTPMIVETGESPVPPIGSGGMPSATSQIVETGESPVPPIGSGGSGSSPSGSGN